MNSKSRHINSNLEKVDKHEIQPNEYAELPELTDEMFDRATYKVGNIVKPSPIHYSWIDVYRAMKKLAEFMDEREDLPPKEIQPF
jgi:hypothetical protein